jgi:hypothetical protein
VQQANLAMTEMEKVTQANSSNADSLSHQANHLDALTVDLSGLISDLNQEILGSNSGGLTIGSVPKAIQTPKVADVTPIRTPAKKRTEWKRTDKSA